MYICLCAHVTKGIVKNKRTAEWHLGWFIGPNKVLTLNFLWMCSPKGVSCPPLRRCLRGCLSSKWLSAMGTNGPFSGLTAASYRVREWEPGPFHDQHSHLEPCHVAADLCDGICTPLPYRLLVSFLLGVDLSSLRAVNPCMGPQPSHGCRLLQGNALRFPNSTRSPRKSEWSEWSLLSTVERTLSSGVFGASH